VLIGYPDEAAEEDIIRLVRGESAGATSNASEPISEEVIFAARKEIDAVHSAQPIDRYLVDLIFATRFPERYSEALAGWIEVGASPRGGIALDRCARAHAWLAGKDFVSPDDVRAVAHNVLRHRLILSYEASADGVTSDQVVSEVVKQVAVP